MSYYKGKKILIIGGTGTIGSSLVKELLNHNPSVIRVFSRDEYKQFLMENEYRGNNKFRFLIGDVRDYDRVERAMNGVDIVFNLAAMKHVPACEYNPTEAIKTNVGGMENVIKAALHHNIQCVVFTSSDKAISPTNTYGATKMLAEKLVQAANYSKGPVRTKFVAVRFGNVMGSRGSVIPFFREQIEKQKLMTITNGDMTRFMMTSKQAVNLILEAAEKSIGGEVFVLKMPIMKLKDLSEVVLEETCKARDIKQSEVMIKNIGLRAGEKLYEELMTDEEAKYAYDLGNMYSIIPISPSTELYKEFYKKFKNCSESCYRSDRGQIIDKDKIKQLLIDENLLF